MSSSNAECGDAAGEEESGLPRTQCLNAEIVLGRDELLFLG